MSQDGEETLPVISGQSRAEAIKIDHEPMMFYGLVLQPCAHAYSFLTGGYLWTTMTIWTLFGSSASFEQAG